MSFPYLFAARLLGAVALAALLTAPIKGRKLAAGPQKGGPIGPPGFRRLARTAGLPRYRRG